MPGTTGKLRFAFLSVALATFLGAISPCDIQARERQKLADPKSRQLKTDVVIATPLFEKMAFGGWEAYKRPFDNLATKLFGLTQNTLLYCRNEFKEAAPPADLVELKNTAASYLASNPVINDAMQARQKARWIIVKELTSGKARHAEAKAPGTATALRPWIDAPLLILSRAPIMGMEKMGPYASPHPISAYDATNKSIAFDTNYIVISNLEKTSPNKTPFNVGSSVKNNTLDLVVCHEMAHTIMYDAYGRPGNVSVAKGPSIHGHTTEYITDRQLAYAEGWAEAFEAFYGRNKNNMNALGESHYGVASFLIDRQNQVRRDRWLWLNGKSDKTASMKNAAQMMACEGVIAGIFFDILSNRALVSPFEKSIEIMVCKKPADFPGFINAWLECFPGDRRVLLRIFLEHTRYATVDKKITAAYQASYLARRAMKNHDGSNKEASAAEKEYISSKEAAFAKLQKSGSVFAALPAELWFGLELTARKDGKITRFVRINLDLNTADAFLLNYSGLFKDKELEEFLAIREKKGGFSGQPLKVLSQVMGKDRWEKLTSEGFKLFPDVLPR